MAFVDDFLDMMPDTVIVTPGVLDETGGFVPSGAVLNLPCRIEGSSRLARNRDGREVVSSLTVIVGAYSNLTVDLHRYTVPGRYSPGTLIQAITIEKESDEDGPVYEAVILP